MAPIVVSVSRPRALLAVLLGVLAAALLGMGMMGLRAYSAQAATAATAATTCTESLQAQIDAAEPGEVLSAAPCIYRERIEINKPLTLKGQEGTEIRGSDVFGSWRKRLSDGRYVSRRTVPPFPETMDQIFCMPDTVRCHLPEQVFFDGRALVQVVGNQPPQNRSEEHTSE